MKNKKLFAILTLVCFMFTLMPVAAFAADNYVEVSKDNANWDDSATVNVGANVYVQTATGSCQYFTVNGDGELDQLATAGPITFDEPDTYKVYAVEGTLVADLIAATTMLKADKLELLMESDNLVDDYATVKVKASNVDYRISLDETEVTTDVTAVTAYEEYNVTIVANDGWDEDGLITATLEKTVDGTNYEAVKGAKLTFDKAGYVDVTVKDATTDRGGDVEFEVASDRAGSYTMYVKYGTEAKVKLNVTVTASRVAGVEVVNVPAGSANVDYPIVAADIEFKFTDANGVAYPVADADRIVTLPTSEYKITVVSQPADSDMDGDDFALICQAADLSTGRSADATGVLTLSGVVGTDTFEEEGKYVIKVTLRNGASAEATVNVAEQGDIVGIAFNKAPVTVAYAGTHNVIGYGVVAIGAKGVATPVGATFSVSGRAVDSFDGSSVTMKGDEDYIGSTITVFAVYEDFTVSNTITVVDDAALIKYTTTEAEVGVNNTLYAYVLDGNGKVVTLTGATTVQAIVLEAPENAVVVANAVEYTAKKGVELNLLASVAGEYKIQTIVMNGGKYVTSIDTFTVGATEGTFKDVVVLSIGANNIVVNSDVKAIAAAPMIKDNRTFVPFRALAEAFGADVEWVEATQSVVAELNGVKVVMNIGEKAYTVNGAAKTADVAPFINGASTMVPVRFVAEAFGINVTPIYAENGAVADVLFAK